MVKVLLLEGVSNKAVSMFTDLGYEVEVEKRKLSEEELIERLQGVSCLGIRSATQVTEKVLLSTSLLCIGCFCIGYDQVDLGMATKLGIAVFNSPFCNTRSVAELIIGQIINLSRQVGDRNMELHQGVWNKTSAGCREIREKTLGIVGYGNIGSQVSVLAECMGMKIIFYDVVKKLALGNSKQVPSLQELLSRSDFVTLHVPDTESTVDLIGEKELLWMKPGSCLLNASRGRVVDLHALVDALQSKHLSGAYLDVYPNEPVSVYHSWFSKLQNLPNVILTPHIGGSTEEAQEAIGVDVAEKLIAFLSCHHVEGSVNLHA
ncbi:D-3-phosphoglycerate dehydrogenase type 2 [Brazilian cedratvirus IHUMI]|uniref:D-3-phosphoglycerate dehydrogenase type 2 n=1 Tax=Brazilian cedratvirus IHUMI TaxID=2126980 RepID=A0A2R8FDS8_9VIRU|nr:D-3-phosphoglycerate dehydrogenase type 2 [Brazilian cedratvirus IHUMI]